MLGNLAAASWRSPGDSDAELAQLGTARIWYLLCRAVGWLK